jgi:Myotubularin-like phosphatase domain
VYTSCGPSSLRASSIRYSNDRYDQQLLGFLFVHLYSCRFSTFIFNNERERQEFICDSQGESIFAYILENKSSFLNPLYCIAADCSDAVGLGKGKQSENGKPGTVTKSGVLFPGVDLRYWKWMYVQYSVGSNLNLSDSKANDEIYDPSYSTTGDDSRSLASKSDVKPLILPRPMNDSPTGLSQRTYDPPANEPVTLVRVPQFNDDAPAVLHVQPMSPTRGFFNEAVEDFQAPKIPSRTNLVAPSEATPKFQQFGIDEKGDFDKILITFDEKKVEAMTLEYNGEESIPQRSPSVPLPKTSTQTPGRRHVSDVYKNPWA